MQFNMIHHPTTPPAHPPFKVWADVEHAHILGATASAKIWFCVSAPVGRFVIPEPQEPARADGLWRTTCFEMFLKQPGDDAYREWNFAPSGQWAAYDFAAYREYPANADVGFAPEILLQDNLTWWQVGVTVPVEEGPWQLGLSAVLEEQDGTKSYWAIAHPAGEKLDFHAPDCFAAKLP
ncbi:MAG: DOMON-like domain-containing protein [Sphingomonas sp.]|jgi:hypothetical protein|nr:DOMON-like domain-containing protein [Sphingomonas sp.]